MVTVLKVIDSAECSWCGKAKEVVEAKLDNGVVLRLCFPDFKKTLKMRLLESGRQPERSA